ALRLAVLKHVRNWSCEETEREVRANVVYRQFTRIGAQKVPDAKTLGRLLQTLGPDVVQQIHQRLVAVAQEKKVARGRRLRVDTTVVERNIVLLNPTLPGFSGPSFFCRSFYWDCFGLIPASCSFAASVFPVPPLQHWVPLPRQEPDGV